MLPARCCITPSGIDPGITVTLVGSELSATGTEIEAVSLAGVLTRDIVSQSATHVVVRAAASPSVAYGAVTVVTSTYNTTSAYPYWFLYSGAGRLDVVQPAVGSVSGGTIVTLQGYELGDPQDAAQSRVLLGNTSLALRGLPVRAGLATLLPARTAYGAAVSDDDQPRSLALWNNRLLWARVGETGYLGSSGRSVVVAVLRQDLSVEQDDYIITPTEAVDFIAPRVIAWPSVTARYVRAVSGPK